MFFVHPKANMPGVDIDPHPDNVSVLYARAVRQVHHVGVCSSRERARGPPLIRALLPVGVRVTVCVLASIFVLDRQTHTHTHTHTHTRETHAHYPVLPESARARTMRPGAAITMPGPKGCAT